MDNKGEEDSKMGGIDSAAKTSIVLSSPLGRAHRISWLFALICRNHLFPSLAILFLDDSPESFIWWP